MQQRTTQFRSILRYFNDRTGIRAGFEGSTLTHYETKKGRKSFTLALNFNNVLFMF